MANRNGMEVPEHILLREYVRIIVSAFPIDESKSSKFIGEENVRCGKNNRVCLY